MCLRIPADDAFGAFNVPDPVWEEGTRKREMESHLLLSSRVEEFLIQIKWKLLRSERDAWKGLMKDACDDAIKAEEKHFVASKCGVELKRERIFFACATRSFVDMDSAQVKQRRKDFLISNDDVGQVDVKRFSFYCSTSSPSPSRPSFAPTEHHHESRSNTVRATQRTNPINNENNLNLIFGVWR